MRQKKIEEAVYVSQMFFKSKFCLLNFKSGWIDELFHCPLQLSNTSAEKVCQKPSKSQQRFWKLWFSSTYAKPTNKLVSTLLPEREWRGQLNTLLYIASQFQEAVKTSSTVHLKAGFSTEIRMINWCTLEERTTRSDSKQEKEKKRGRLTNFKSHVILIPFPLTVYKSTSSRRN